MENQTIDYSNDILSLKDINERCEAYVIKYFTVGKQLTVERVGSDLEKELMHGFIDACRAWANSEHPKLKDLYVINP